MEPGSQLKIEDICGLFPFIPTGKGGWPYSVGCPEFPFKVFIEFYLAKEHFWLFLGPRWLTVELSVV